MNCCGDCDVPGCSVCDDREKCFWCQCYLGGQAVFEVRQKAKLPRRDGTFLVTAQMCSICASSSRAVGPRVAERCIVLVRTGMTRVGRLCDVDGAYAFRSAPAPRVPYSDDELPF